MKNADLPEILTSVLKPVWEMPPPPARRRRPRPANITASYSLALALERHIFKVMKLAEGNISKASMLLGIPRRTLQRKLRRMRKTRP